MVILKLMFLARILRIGGEVLSFIELCRLFRINNKLRHFIHINALLFQEK